MAELVAHFVGRVGYFLAGAVVTFVAMLFIGPAWSSVVEYSFPRVIVTTEELEEREPDLEATPSIVERFVFRTIPPAQLAVAPGGGAADVAAFCRPVVVSTTDTVAVADTVFLVRSGRVDEPSVLTPWRALRFRATGPTNVGDLAEYTFHPRGSFAFQASGDSLLVRHGRFAFARDAWETGSQLWALYSIIEAAMEAF